MAELPLGWNTDLAVLDAAGARITGHCDYLLVRTPGNPGYHWGNFILVLDEGAVDEPERWVATFERHFPRAEHRAIGLPCAADPSLWNRAGLELGADEALLAESMPQLRPLPAGYTVRQLSDPGDWRRSAEAHIAEHSRAGGEVVDAYEAFEFRLMHSSMRIAERGLGAYFGVFTGGRLVAQLGIVKCGPRARYQGVLTDVDHRRRGLAGHLLGVAADWARTQGNRQWVIVAEPDSPAGRLYRSVGFVPTDRSYQAYRAKA